MSGSIALKISKKMNTQLARVRRGLMTAGDAIITFNGYLDGLSDVDIISKSEVSAFMREFTKILIG